jgi:hypothetical protein
MSRADFKQLERRDGCKLNRSDRSAESGALDPTVEGDDLHDLAATLEHSQPRRIRNECPLRIVNDLWKLASLQGH